MARKAEVWRVLLSKGPDMETPRFSDGCGFGVGAGGALSGGDHGPRGLDVGDNMGPWGVIRVLGLN